MNVCENSALKTIETLKALRVMDITVGKKIKIARIIRDVTQADLASLIGCSYQQIQRYEKGRNPVKASQLHLLAKALKCNWEFFFTPAEGELK